MKVGCYLNDQIQRFAEEYNIKVWGQAAIIVSNGYHSGLNQIQTL